MANNGLAVNRGIRWREFCPLIHHNDALDLALAVFIPTELIEHHAGLSRSPEPQCPPVPNSVKLAASS